MAVEYQLHRKRNSDIFRFLRHRETLEDLKHRGTWFSHSSCNCKTASNSVCLSEGATVTKRGQGLPMGQFLTDETITQMYSKLTCLLNCMIPKVGNTQALAGGTISESAKLTHCSTWALAWGVLPRRASLLTVRRKQQHYLGVIKH